VPLIRLMYLTQVINAVLLPLHVIALILLARDAKVMGALRIGSNARLLGWGSVLLIVACVAALAVSELSRRG
jgi:Mn2+/Fe2+ NRAMP family transporter